MNDTLQIIILAVIQGLTEFLPVSSSGHLVLIEKLIDFNEQGNMTEVVLHAGTFIAIIVYFFKRLLKIGSDCIKGDRVALTYVGAIALGSIPIVVVYVLAGDLIESLFDKPLWPALFLCVTGLILLSLKLQRKKTNEKVTPLRGLIVGTAQAFALLPGISRSGSTIVAARHLGIAPEKSAEFSFLLCLPAMLGAIVIKALSIASGLADFNWRLAIIGVLVSAVVGYVALAALITIVKRSKLHYFGIYCLLAGAVSILLLIF